MFAKFADDNSISDSVAFLENCELDNCSHVFHAQSRMMAFDVDERAAEGMVIGESVVSITAGMSQENKQIVQDTLMFARLAANAAEKNAIADGKDSDRAWYDMYTKVLGRCGWVTQGNGNTQYQLKHSSFTMEQVALDIIDTVIKASILTGPTKILMLNAAKETVAKLKGGDKPLRLFESSSKRHSGAKFAIASSAELKNGDVVMSMGTVRFETRLNVTNVLLTEWSSSQVDIKSSEDHVNLNHDHYNNRAREVVERRLAKETLSALENIEF